MFIGHYCSKINKFLDEIDELAEHFDLMGDSLEANPVLTIDYFRRAYLINGDPIYFEKVKELLDKEKFDSQTKFGIKNFLATEEWLKRKEWISMTEQKSKKMNLKPEFDVRKMLF